MKHRLLVAAGAAALAAVLAGTAGCGGSGGTGGGAGSLGDTKGDPKASGTLHVWLQVDAQNGWADTVQAATTAFHKKYPKVTVQVDYQQWSDHLTKLDAALAGSTPPDLIEMGDTETSSYLANGAFADLTADTGLFDNHKTWNRGLAASCTYQQKVWCVPYYSGSRVVIYRKDMFAAVGITAPPKSQAELLTDGQKLMAKYGASDPTYSAFYMPGKYWYAATTFVNDAGGSIATHSGKTWKGDLTSAQSVQGLTAWKDLTDKLSKANKSGDEANPQQSNVMAQGHVGMMYGLGWEAGSVFGPPAKGGNPALKDQIGMFAMPSASGDKPMQSFAGGSDLAIAAKSKHQNWAAAWARAMTSTASERALMKAGNVPNTTSLLAEAQNDPALAPFAASAQNSWMVPIAPNWPKVEKSLVIQNGLADIATGKSSVADAAKQMNQQVQQDLNGS